MGRDGLGAKGSIDGAHVGDPYELESADGDALVGVIQILNPPMDFCASVQGMNDALLRLRIDDGCMTSPSPEVNVWLSTFDVPSSETDGLQQRWSAMLERLFAGSAVESSGKG